MPFAFFVGPTQTVYPRTGLTEEPQEGGGGLEKGAHTTAPLPGAMFHLPRLDGLRTKAVRQVGTPDAHVRAQQVNTRKQLYNKLQELRGNIRVYCRVRPLSEKERLQHSEVCACGMNAGTHTHESMHGRTPAHPRARAHTHARTALHP